MPKVPVGDPDKVGIIGAPDTAKAGRHGGLPLQAHLDIHSTHAIMQRTLYCKVNLANIVSGV